MALKKTGSIGTSQTKPPLVLVYHGTPPKRTSDRYALRADRFRRHLDYLAVNGWQTLTMGELMAGDHL